MKVNKNKTCFLRNQLIIKHEQETQRSGHLCQQRCTRHSNRQARKVPSLNMTSAKYRRLLWIWGREIKLAQGFRVPANQGWCLGSQCIRLTTESRVCLLCTCRSNLTASRRSWLRQEPSIQFRKQDEEALTSQRSSDSFHSTMKADCWRRQTSKSRWTLWVLETPSLKCNERTYLRSGKWRRRCWRINLRRQDHLLLFKT